MLRYQRSSIVVLAAALLTAVAGAAPITYAVTVDTAPQPGYVDFQFLPAPGAVAATASIREFSLSGGGQLLPPVDTVFPLPFNTPTATGSLETEVIITNTDAFNAWLQRLEFGTSLGFLVTLSGPALDTAGNAAGTDFSLFLYDENGLVLLGGPALVLAIGPDADVSVTTAPGVRVSVVPEPATFFLFASVAGVVLLGRLRRKRNVHATAIAFLLTGISATAAPVLVNSVELAGNSVDLVPGSGANVNRLGMFSDLYYNASTNLFYGLSDRGPGGGLLSYGTRVQEFSLDVSSTTGEISGFNLTRTIQFQTQSGNAYNGLNPGLLNGDVSKLGLSFDPEGFVVAPNGRFYVSDEYGPSVYEFTADGKFVRAFEQPSNVLPRDANGPNFGGTVTEGRQDNRGYEGLTMSPDGSKLYSILQDPLQNEGSPDGRRSQNLRIVEFDTATGKSTAQYAYQLESLADINARVVDDFGPNAQGRNIGVSSITALGNNRFLIIERDNRGLGVDGALDSTPSDPGSKRVYIIDITGATDISQIGLGGTNSLPPGVIPVSKSLYLDVQAALLAAGLPVTEKLEGLTVGPRLSDGSYLLLLGTDSDYSVTQTGNGTQFDVCINAAGAGIEVPIDSGCPAGTNLIPGYLYAFKADDLDYVSPAAIPEPSTWGLFTAGLLALTVLRRKH